MFDCILKPWTKGCSFSSTKEPETWGFAVCTERWVVSDRERGRGIVAVSTGVDEEKLHVASKKGVFRIHKLTGEVSNPESPSKISKKCLFLIATTPLFALARMVYFAVRIVFDQLQNLFEGIQSFIFQLSKDGFMVAFKVNLRDFMTLGVLSFLSNVWEILRTPFYALGISLSAVEGAFSDPLKGARRVAHIEAKLNHINFIAVPHQTIHDVDIRQTGILQGITKFLQVPSFHPYGNLNHSTIDTLTNIKRFKLDSVWSPSIEGAQKYLHSQRVRARCVRTQSPV